MTDLNEADALLRATAAELRATDHDTIQSLDNDIKRAVELMEIIDGIKGALAAHQESLKRLLTNSIPDAMAALGVVEKEIDGNTVTYAPFISGSLPKGERERESALDWLQRNGAGPLVKAFFDFQLPKGARSEKKVAAMIERVEAILNQAGYDLQEEVTIHTQTLYAFVRERMRKGEPVPFETLGVFAGRIAKIKRPLPPPRDYEDDDDHWQREP